MATGSIIYTRQLPAGETAIALWTVDHSYDEGYCALLTNGEFGAGGPRQ